MITRGQSFTALRGRPSACKTLSFENLKHQKTSAGHAPRHCRQAMQHIISGQCLFQTTAHKRASCYYMQIKEIAPPSGLILFLSSLCAVEGPALLAVYNACRVERASDDMITNSGQISDPAASDENHAMLLQVMADAGDIASSLGVVRKPYTCNFAQRRVGLFGCSRAYLYANAALLRAILQQRGLGLFDIGVPALAYKLINCGQFQHLLPTNKN
jgi:hypothetical protein